MGYCVGYDDGYDVGVGVGASVPQHADPSLQEHAPFFQEMMVPAASQHSIMPLTVSVPPPHEHWPSAVGVVGTAVVGAAVGLFVGGSEGSLVGAAVVGAAVIGGAAGTTASAATVGDDCT